MHWLSSTRVCGIYFIDSFSFYCLVVRCTYSHTRMSKRYALSKTRHLLKWRTVFSNLHWCWQQETSSKKMNEWMNDNGISWVMVREERERANEKEMGNFYDHENGIDRGIYACWEIDVYTHLLDELDRLSIVVHEFFILEKDHGKTTTMIRRSKYRMVKYFPEESNQ